MRAAELIALACAALGAACVHGGMPPSSQSPLLGASAPAFRRPAVTGGEVDTSAPGRLVVIEFFARFCKPCLPRLRAAAALSRELPDVAFVGVSLDERADAAVEVARRLGLPFPVVHDAGLALSARFRVSELPAAFIISPEGRTLWFGGPEQTEDAIRDALLAARR